MATSRVVLLEKVVYNKYYVIGQFADIGCRHSVLNLRPDSRRHHKSLILIVYWYALDYLLSGDDSWIMCSN